MKNGQNYHVWIPMFWMTSVVSSRQWSSQKISLSVLVQCSQMWPRHIVPCVTLGTAPLCFHNLPSKTRRLFILLSGTGCIPHLLSYEEWAKLPCLDTNVLNHFCGFFKTVEFSENISLSPTALQPRVGLGLL